MRALTPELLDKIGNTPLIELRSFSDGSTRILAKLEWFNPFGSVKDRAAYWMFKDAERRGLIVRGKHVIIEPTSGNTGIALTGIARLLGYEVEIVIPEKVSEETKGILRSLGANLYETSDDLCPRVGVGTDQSISLAKAIARARPERYYMPNQYENDANFLAHYEGTGPEIWAQTNGMVTHFVAGVGTGGTITGVGLYLKERSKAIRVIAVQPQRQHLIQGLRNFEESNVPTLFERRAHVVDEWYTITNEESFKMVRELYERERLLVGPSSGCAMAAACKVRDSMGSSMEGYNEHGKGGRRERDRERVIVVVFADNGRKFRSLYTQQGVFSSEEFDDALRSAVMLGESFF
ncbi:MAG: cysteine synthase family protein [Candidatus Nitrosocaldus sp.]|nr:cysteine synthase family protein [Candidatus Nitrosocaldus sp.]